MIQYKDKFIGEKQVASVTKTEEKTTSGVEILSVEYADGTKELISSLLLNKVISDEPCDVSKLRDKRLFPIVEEVLKILRDWGLKLSELSYLSTLINQSIAFNQSQALIEVLGKYTGNKLLNPDDVDMLTLDKILKEINSEVKLTIDDIINGNK